MKTTLGHTQRLKSRKLIGELYEFGKVVKVFPLRMVYIPASMPIPTKTQVGVSVAKRNFKKAVDRNKLKRLLRESYRKQQPNLHRQLDNSYVFMISYLAKDHWTYDQIDKKMQKLLDKFIEEINNEKV